MSESLPAWLEPVWQRLAPALDQDRLGQVLLFTGPPGVGKRRLARVLTRALLCLDPAPGGLACGTCRGCAQSTAGSHPDYADLRPGEGAKEIRVDQSRTFARRLSLTAQYRRRVGLIDPPEALNTSAANSLLKTLEEPPAGTHLLLVSDRPSAVLATIRSRSQLIRVPLPDPAAADAWARERGPEVAAALALARGAPERAERLAEADVVSLLPQWWDRLAALAAGREDPLQVARHWHEAPPERLLDWLYLTVADLLKRQDGIDTSYWVQAAHAERLAYVAEYLDGGRLRRLIPVLIRTRRLLDSNVDRQLLWESVAIELWACRQRGRARRDTGSQ